MKLVTYQSGAGPRLGAVSGEGLVDVARHVAGAPADMIALIRQWKTVRPRLAQALAGRPDQPLAGVKLRQPILRPGKILAIGLNYLDHIAETRAQRPTYPTFFAKMPTAANGPYDPIEFPAVSSELDYEAEMVVVIGRRCRNLPQSRAREAIFGYCTGNDVSVRDWQKRTPQWTVGKSFDTHAPFGPWITTADEVDTASLGIRSLVNGEVRQNSNTGQMLFDSAAQIEHLSQAMTLEPGDLIYTGTPAGVGMARNPPIYLKPGDVVRVEIDGLGAIENRVEAAPGEMRLE
ncbi:MAG TPA: fumarylacetoacetate hydrolase family protein [Rhizomicrobium sp.]|jgi:2-keto-4-pentenoate hydratase/2-oxohepta-3-ene-1,7-dioic acid hydratase in catechol pathway|nr:fumarylacetoacetate hydrolase family protein [Rhizomicrobium sp.]